MQHTAIEWCLNPDGTPGYSFNPIKGLCPGVYAECAEYCYARKLYKRYGWNPEIRLDEKELNCRMPKAPSRIFVGSTFDLSFANPYWIEKIRNITIDYSWHTFIFLTKNPIWYSQHIWPSNCWLGMTVYGYSKTAEDNRFCENREKSRFQEFKKLDVPNLKFVSFEPLLRDALGDEDLKGIGWVIIGARTSPNIQPKKEWVEKIIDQAETDKAKVFMKNNLELWPQIQEIPESK